MSKYLDETEYAVTNLINLISHERNQLEIITEEHKELVHLADVLYSKFYNEDLSDFTPDFFVQKSYFEAFSAITARDDLRDRKAELQNSIQAKDFSIRSLSGALLQIARQGISLRHKGYENAPDVRSVGTLPIKLIIWEGRNQSIHYEEGKYRKGVKDCFAILESQFGDQFSLTKHVGKNLSLEIINLLGWNNYLQYKSDMTKLLMRNN